MTPFDPKKLSLQDMVKVYVSDSKKLYPLAGHKSSKKPRNVASRKPVKR